MLIQSLAQGLFRDKISTHLKRMKTAATNLESLLKKNIQKFVPNETDHDARTPVG